MFDNSVLAPYSGITVSVTDTDNGRTTRRFNAGGGHFHEIVIGHQESAENKPVVTDRTLVQRNVISTGTSGKPIRASVGLVFAYPREGTDHTQMLNLTKDVIAFLCGGANMTADQHTALVANLARLFNGES